MSWKNGSQETDVHPASGANLSTIWSRFLCRALCVTTTPAGVLVEPDVY